MVVRYICEEVNSVADCMVSFIAQHFVDILWTNMSDAPVNFKDILFSDFVRYIYYRLV